MRSAKKVSAGLRSGVEKAELLSGVGKAELLSGVPKNFGGTAKTMRRVDVGCGLGPLRA